MIDIFSYKLGQKAGGGGEIALQDKTITENGEYTADAGYDGFGKVTVDVAGSGGGGGIATGVIIPAEDVVGTTIDIVHNLGEIPKLAVVFRELTADGFGYEKFVSNEVAFSIAINREKRSVTYCHSSGSSVSVGAAAYDDAIYLSQTAPHYLSASCVGACTETTAKLYPAYNSSKNRKFAAGNKYRWILFTEGTYNAI